MFIPKTTFISNLSLEVESRKCGRISYFFKLPSLDYYDKPNRRLIVESTHETFFAPAAGHPLFLGGGWANVAEALYSITRRRIAREQVEAFDLHVRGLDQGGVAIRSPARVAPNRLADALEFSHRGYGPKQLRSDGDGILWIK